MYTQRKNIMIQDATPSKSIIGSGYFNPGIYTATIKEISVHPTSNIAEILWEDTSGATHKERWFINNQIKKVGYTLEWIRFRAGMLPDLECQRFLDKDVRNAELLKGFNATITVEYTIGWRLERNGSKYVVVDHNKNQLSQWHDKISNALSHAERLNLKKSYLKIDKLMGHKDNVINFKEKIIND